MTTVMVRTAIDDFDALLVARAMADFSLRIVSVVPWRDQLLVYAQADVLGFGIEDSKIAMIDERINNYHQRKPTP